MKKFIHKAVTVTLLTGGLLLCIGTLAIADPQSHPGMENPDRLERVHKRIEMIRIWKLTDALDLDEATASKLFPVLNRYDRERMRLERERFMLMREARESSGQDKDSARDGEILERMEKNQAALFDIHRQRHEAVKKILPPEKMNRFVVFEHQFEQEMQQRIHEARKNREKFGGPMERRPWKAPPGRPDYPHPRMDQKGDRP